MKKLRYWLIGLLLIIGSLGVIPAASAATMPAYGNYKLTWNIESIYYYIDQSAPGYSGTIAAAANNWVYTGLGYNKLYPNTRTYNKTNSAVDFYAAFYGNYAFTAMTETYKRVNGNAVSVGWVEVPNRTGTGVPAENYLFAEIHINNDIFDGYTDFNQRQGIIAHEFGHAWGLGHNPENPNSIMYNWDSRNVYTIQQVDQDAFNALYP